MSTLDKRFPKFRVPLYPQMLEGRPFWPQPMAEFSKRSFLELIMDARNRRFN
jgi:hypothetical protein